ncbi:MAG TPA: hypothetical protein VIL85_00955, partial [Thermomicrobiales bacterium]
FGSNQFVGCNFFDSTVTVQADNTTFRGCGFCHVAGGYGGQIKSLGYKTSPNESGWDAPGINVPLQPKNNKVPGCIFERCDTSAITAGTHTDGTTTWLSCDDMEIADCTFAARYRLAIDVKANYLVVKNCQAYDSGQLGSSTVKCNSVLGAARGYCTNLRSYDNRGTPTVAKDFFIDNQLSATALPTMDLAFRDCASEVGGAPTYYTGSGFTSTRPANITLRGTNNLGINPEVTYSQGSVTGSVTFDRKNGQTIAATLTGNLTPTLAPGAFLDEELNLELTQDATGNRTWAKPVNGKVPGGMMPISTAANARDLYRWRSDGVSWLLVGYQLNLS